MYEDTKGFKTAVVGGFNREDVLQYIEQSAKENNERIEALQADAEQARTEAEELQQDNAALSQKNAELLERLGQMTVEEDVLRQEANQAREQAERDAAAVQSLQESLRAAEEEGLRLREQVGKLQTQACEYQASKERLAEIELCAYRRAKEVEEQAQQNAQHVRVQSAELISQVKRLLVDATAQYRAAHQRFVAETTDARQRTETVLENIDVVLETLDEVMVGELSRGQGNASERPSLAEVSELLKGEE